jgi:transposase
MVSMARDLRTGYLLRHQSADGRRVSPRRGKGALSAEEAGQIRQWIAERTPDQLELPFALWTSRAVRELIERRFAKRFGLTAVQLPLRRWGLTPQKPLARTKERKPVAVAAWVESHRHEIELRYLPPSACA